MHINTIGGSHGKASADFINYQSVNPANFMFNQHSTIELNGKDKQTWYVDNTNGSVPVQSENISEKGDVRRSKNFKIYIPGHDNETTVNVLNNDLTNTPEGLLNPDILGNILAGSLPGQIFRLTGTGNEEIFTRKIGQKKYEIKDHLQSSIITVSDVKKPIDIENDGNFESAEAQIISYQEFYPGGQPMPGRTINNNTYRFGYNAGSEKDDEITGVTGSHYTTFFRELDTRIGRWWQTDPETSLTPWESPFVSMGNNPVLNTDILGNVLTDFKDKEGKLLKRIDDGSNATFQLTGDSWSNEYFKFTGYDKEQKGKDEVNIQSVQDYSQDYTRETFKSTKNSSGGWTTYCNYGTRFIATSIASGLKETGITLNLDAFQGGATAIYNSLKSSDFKSLTLQEAQKEAKSGSFIAGGWSGHAFTLNKEGKINNVGAPRATNNIWDPQYSLPTTTKFYLIYKPVLANTDK